jgi:Fe2+ or Zn2+ uptake regulation protein
MLKIKDLSVLEEHGFLEKTDQYGYYYYIYSEENWDACLIVYEEGKWLTIETDYDIDDICDECLDKLYDLIKLGLVEKV